MPTMPACLGHLLCLVCQWHLECQWCHPGLWSQQCHHMSSSSYTLTHPSDFMTTQGLAWQEKNGLSLQHTLMSGQAGGDMLLSLVARWRWRRSGEDTHGGRKHGMPWSGTGKHFPLVYHPYALRMLLPFFEHHVQIEFQIETLRLSEGWTSGA